MTKILDTSHYQKNINWDKITDPMILKCTESTNFLDPTFKERQKILRDKGLYFGSYHFFRDVNIDKQVVWYLKNADWREGEIMVLDFEINCPDAVNKCNQFLSKIHNPYFYTNEARMNQMDIKYPLWIARYGTNNGMPQTPPTKDWKIWQFTSKGKVDGISGYVDLNEAKTSPSPIPAPTEPSGEYIYPLDKVFITQKFGENPQMYKKYDMIGHNGVDFRTRFIDSPLGHRYTMAVKKGKVIEAKYDSGYGWMVRLEHDLDVNGNEQTIYGHHKKLYVKVGDYVKQGQTIALTDNTGASTGSHLHLGWRKKGWLKEYNNGFKGYSDILNNLR